MSWKTKSGHDVLTLGGIGVVAVAAAVLWAVPAGAFIVADVVTGVRRNRAARKAKRLRADQARLDIATNTATATGRSDADGDADSWEVTA